MQISNLWAVPDNQFPQENLIGQLLIKTNLILLKNFAENLNWENNQINRATANTNVYKKTIIFVEGKSAERHQKRVFIALHQDI